MGRSGLTTDGCSTLLRQAHLLYPNATRIVLHVAGNDFMAKPLHEVKYAVQQHLLEAKLLFPHASIYYSLPFTRIVYRNENKKGAGERARKHLISHIKSFCVQENIGIIHHRDITTQHIASVDGVHLTAEGEQIFLNNIFEQL